MTNEVLFSFKTASKGKHNSQQILNALISLNCDKSEWNAIGHRLSEES